MRTPTEQFLQDIVPDLYEDYRAFLGMSPGTDMARSNQCHMLTKGLFEAFNRRGVTVRRELHQLDDGRWHFLIAHAPTDAVPSQRDIVTDLNPWQYGGPETGYLHGERFAVQQELGNAGAPAWFVSLRGIVTITQAHTEALAPTVQ